MGQQVFGNSSTGRYVTGFAANVPRSPLAIAMQRLENETAKKAAAEEEVAKPVRRSGPAVNPRNIKAADYSHRWPQMVIGRKIDTGETGKGWRDFETKMNTRLHGKGRVVPLSSWRLVYYTPDQMSDMFTERFDKLSREGSQKAIRSRAQESIADINDGIKRLIGAKLVADQIMFDESPLARQRYLNPDDIQLEFEDKRLCDEREQVNDMWLGTNFKAGRQEGYGAHGLGFQLIDDNSLLAQEAAAIDEILQDYGFDTTDARRNRRFAIKVADTSPLPATNFAQLQFPPYPFGLPLQGPRAVTL